MAGVRLRVLGSVEAEVDGNRIDLGGPRQRSVLERLLVVRGEVVAVDRIVDDLWRGEPPRQAIGALQAYVSHLRRVLEPDRPPRSPATVLVSAPPGYAVRLPTEAVDAWWFERRVRDGLAAGTADPKTADPKTADPATAAAAFDEALGLWRGTAYAEVAEQPWAFGEVGRLAELRRLAQERRAEAAIALGSADIAVGNLEALLADHPEREGAWRLLALALYATGRQADALAALRRARVRLARDHGLDPGAALVALEADMLAQRVVVPGRAMAVAVPAAAVVERDIASGPVKVLAPAARRPVLPSPADEFVGRRGELVSLREAAGRAGRGRLTVAAVAGEPGGGKSALVEHLVRELDDAGWRVALGRCPEAEGSPPAWAWTEVLRTLVDRGDGDGDGDRDVDGDVDRRGDRAGPVRSGPGRVGLARLLGRRDGTPTTTAGADDPASRFRLHREVADLLGAAVPGASAVPEASAAPGVAAVPPGRTGRAGLVLALDDLHRADEETLALLRSVGTALEAHPVLVVVAYRPAEVSTALEDTLAALASATTVRLRLAGLDRADAAALLADAAGSTVDGATVDALAERTGGNPFYLRESARLLASEGSVAALGAVPDGVRDVLRRRFARLPDVAVAVLRLASLLGRDVDVDVLVEAAEVDEEAVLEALEAGLLAGLLTEPQTGRVRFTHVLVRETLESDLSLLRQARWHSRVARTLERIRPDDSAALAHHHGRAATPTTAARALDYTCRAAEDAELRFAHLVAASLWRQALELAELVPAGPGRPGPPARVELLGRLVRAQVLAGATMAARHTQQTAVRLAMSVGDDRLLARALTLWDLPSLWTPRPYGNVDLEVVGHLERLLASPLATGAGQAAVEIRCRLLCALVVEIEGEPDGRAAGASREAVEAARALDDPSLLCLALNARVFGVPTHVLVDERRAIGGELVEIGRRHDLMPYVVLGYLTAVQANVAALDFRAAHEAVQAGARVTRQYQLPQGEDILMFGQAMVQHVAGALDDAERTYEQAVAGVRRHGSFNADGIGVLALMTVRATAGRIVEMIPQLRMLYDSVGGVAADSLAYALLVSGDREQAAALHRSRVPVRDDYLWLLFTAVRARVVAGLGEVEEAREVYGLLLPVAGQLAGAACGSTTFGPVAQLLGDLALVLGRPSAAAEHYRHALDVAERVGSPQWAAAARHALASLTPGRTYT